MGGRFSPGRSQGSGSDGLLPAFDGSSGRLRHRHLGLGQVRAAGRAQEDFFVAADDLEQLIDLCYRLTRLRVGDELFVVNDSYLATLVGADATGIDRLKKALPAWTLVVRVGGRALMAAERMAVAENDIAAEVSRRGLRLQTALQAVSTKQIDAVLDGLAEEPHWKLRYKGGVRDIFFHSTLENVPAFLHTMIATAEAHKYPASDVGVYLQPQHQGVAYHCESASPSIPRTRGDGQDEGSAFHGQRKTYR